LGSSRGVELKCDIEFSRLFQPLSRVMRMKRYTGLLLAAVAAVYLQGCIGSGGNSASPPTDVHVVPKDSRVVVTWTMLPGVEYWIFKAAGDGVTPKNCSSMSLCTITLQATSPASIPALLNDPYSYSFSINARTNGGPGGAGSPAILVTPRLSGKTWNVGATTVTGTSELLGVTYGASGAKFVATGTSGALFSGILSWTSTGAGLITWTPMTNPLPSTLPSTTFNAVNYDAVHAEFLAVGSSGSVIGHVPSSSTVWTKQTSYTPNELFALANNGAGFTVAVGAGGTIITSGDGSTWTPRTSGPPNALHGVAYGYDSTTPGYAFVAVGDAGTILYSKEDGADWTTPVTLSPSTAQNFKSVTFGAAYGSVAGVFVAVGAGGVVYTSSDGRNWTQQTATTIPATTQLNAVTYSASYAAAGRFIAVGEDGNVYYNEYSNLGVNWTAAPQVTTTPIRAVSTGALFDYMAVGTNGLNLYAD
jgi:hypothetical protein